MIKIQRKHLGHLLIIQLILFPIFLIPISLTQNIIKSSHALKTANGVWDYNNGSSVKYEVVINYTLTHTNGAPQAYKFKVARLNNRTPDSGITPFTPPYQESGLIYKDVSSNGSAVVTNIGALDKFNNTYDWLNATLDTNDKISFNYKYNITLNEISFSGITDTDIGSSTPSYIYNLYNVTEPFYNCSDPDLIALSDSFGFTASDNAIERAQTIFNWIISNIVYDEQVSELGASAAYDLREGDCSDLADLMITLLRINNIPARKVTGLLISNHLPFTPHVGNQYTFDLSEQGDAYSTNPLLGHAWMEYYVPDIGWIASDPTWGLSYFNRIDFLRFNFNNGAYFSMPTTPASSASEFPSIPSAICSDHNRYEFDYLLTVTVISSPFTPFDWTFIITIAIIIGIIALVALVIYVIIKKTG